jgi:hypothetical protein
LEDARAEEGQVVLQGEGVQGAREETTLEIAGQTELTEKMATTGLQDKKEIREGTMVRHIMTPFN